MLYWMTAFRRTRYNFSLQRAIDWANDLGKPLVVLEALRVDYPWASDRFHAFAIAGMRDNRSAFANAGVTYFPFLEREKGDGEGLLAALAHRACAVIGDDYPCFFLPAQTRAARRVVPCLFELVDSNGLYPMRSAEKVFARAFDFRRHLQKHLPPHLLESPVAEPLKAYASKDAHPDLRSIQQRWRPATERELAEPAAVASTLPIDHSVKPVSNEPGGGVAAERCLEKFLADRLIRYADERNQPELDAPSGFSAYLHWGHLATHEVFDRVVDQEQWSPKHLADKANGAREGWWGMSPTAEAFLDELVTWREVGFNMAALRRDYDHYESLPEWSRDSLELHACDPREHVYTLQEFEQARTHNELWNAAQRQLVREGRIHNYLRMLWGKKILHWSESPREALRIMIELNNKYALDGRDPNSYSGIFWVLGRYDRAWGPERAIFGKIRYMSADNTARKVRVKDYVRRYAADAEKSLF